MLNKPMTVLLILVVGAVAFFIGQRSGGQGEISDPLQAPLAGSGPEIARILTIPDSGTRSVRLVEAFAGLGPADLIDVERAFAQAMTFVDPVAVVLFADWWTGFDPEAAFAASRTWPLNDPDLGLSAVMRGWARRDPIAARLAFEGMESSTRRDAALRALAQGWSESGNEDGLAKYLETMPDGIARQRAMQILVASMAARDGIDHAIEFAESIPDDAPNRFKLQTYRRVATSVTQIDPARGAAWAIEHADGPYGDSLLRKVATSWIRTDPDAAMAWARGLPPSKQRDVAMREGFREWLMAARPEALAWIRAQEISPELDPALELYASSVGRDNPEAGLELAAQIDSQELRERSTFNIGRAWFALDAESAAGWLESAALSEKLKARILAEAKKRRVQAARRAAGPQKN